MSSAGWADSLASGIGAIAGGGDFEDVAKTIVKESLLNLIPLYSVGTVVVAAVEAIKALLGVDKAPPLLGLMLAADASEELGHREALYRVATAAVQRTAGFKNFQDVRPFAPMLIPEIHDHNFGMWSWLIELQDRLVDAYRGAEFAGIKLELQTSPRSLQAFHAAVALQAWAESTAIRVTKGDFPLGPQLPAWLGGKPNENPHVRYATKPYLELRVRRGGLPFTDKYFIGAERSVLKSKWGLFKRLGLPTFQQYKAAILANAGPGTAPVDELFPGAAASGVEPIEDFAAVTAPPGSAVPAIAATSGASSSAAAIAPTKSAGKPAAQAATRKSAELPVAIGVGGAAILLALL